MSTVDSFTFISAITIGRDLPTILGLKLTDNRMIQLTRVGLGITAIFSISLALYFEYAVDIWYLAGSFAVPALLIPLMAGLYRTKLKHVVFVMILPVIASTFWYVYGVLHPFADGYPGYIWGLDPMYPGVVVSGILFTILKRSKN
jgi:hypothetical protein